MSIVLLFSSPCFSQKFQAPVIDGKETMPGSSDENAKSNGESSYSPKEEISHILSRYEDRLAELQKEIERVIQSYRDKYISRSTAEDDLKSLLQEQYKIRDNPEYRAEKAIQGLLSEQMLRRE